MPKENTHELRAFIAVARERSFTKAAAKIGLSQSALSHTIGNLEKRLGIRLLTRTTRAVAPSAAGQRLLDGIAPLFEAIDAHVDALSELRDKPSGSLRIVSSDYGLTHILWPKIRAFLETYPDIQVELTQDNGLNDIVLDGYDAGVRRGEHLAKDMISARISPDTRFVVVGAPSYFETHPTPRHLKDLADCPCINFRLPSSGGHFVWEFRDEDREVRVRVTGQAAFNNIYDILNAAIDGIGLAYVPEPAAEAAIRDGRLLRVLEDYCPYRDGFYLYYPNRRQASPAFQALLGALRHRG